MQFEQFKATLCGEWHGTKQLYLEPPPQPAATSPSSITITEVAGGNFLQGSYDWSDDGEAQHGMLLFSFSDETGAASAAWVDSFHMSAKVFFCTGTAVTDGMEALGAYEAPPGPDWGWRIAIHSRSATELQIVMHNISPEGQQDLAVQIDYTKAG